MRPAHGHHADPVQQVITKDNMSIGVAAVAYFHRVDPARSIALPLRNLRVLLDRHRALLS